MTALKEVTNLRDTKFVGKDVKQRGGDLMTRGEAKYVADKNIQGQLWARIVRSPVAHAQIVSCDAAKARSYPGVACVLTSADIPDVRFPIRIPMAATPNTERVLQAPLASERVRYVGEPVALVVGSTASVVENAAELVKFEFSALTPVLDLESAADMPAIHPAMGSNTVETVSFSHGEVDKLLAEADIVIHDYLSFPRVTAAPLECRGLVAEWDRVHERMTVWGAAKVKHNNQEFLAEALNLRREQVRLIEMSVGGGFGVRGEFYPEDFLIPFAALKLGKPVKWLEDRSEHFVSINHARYQTHKFTIAASSEGKLLCFRDEAWCDQGAYVRTQGILPTLLPAIHVAGPYDWAGFEIRSNGVLTNRVPVGTVRAPGVTEATFVRERMIDRIAAELAMDPVELRLRNLIKPNQMPFVLDVGTDEPIVYESGDFIDGFRKVLDRGGYKNLRTEQKLLSTERLRYGVGVSAFTEIGSVGPFEDARIDFHDGIFNVYVGVASVGQPVNTTLAQIAADELGVDMGFVAIHHHDTDNTPFGFGAFASRSTTMAGNAICTAARAMRRNASEFLRVDDDELDLISAMTTLPQELRIATGRFDKEHPSFSFGAGLAFVSVDTLYGTVKVLHYTVAYDVGRAINPLLLKGQFTGAVVQGIGSTLFEELAYDSEGQLLTQSLDEYLLPSLYEAPIVETVILEYPVKSNPLGIKGGGEGGVAGVPAAVANAVADALGINTLSQLPLNPSNVLTILASHEPRRGRT